MTKLKAALIHFSISLFVIGLFVLIIFTLWYPIPFFSISKVIVPLKLLVLIDVIVGPLLTFVVYKKNKKYLKIDLSMIALMQILALSYGVYTIYNGRPSLIAMRGGQFHYLMERYAGNESLKFDELKPHIFSAPKMVYVTDQESLDIYATYASFVPIDDYNLMVMPYSLSIDNMKAKFSTKEDQITTLSEKYKEDNIVFFTLNRDGVVNYVVFSTTQNRIIDYLKF